MLRFSDPLLNSISSSALYFIKCFVYVWVSKLTLAVAFDGKLDGSSHQLLDECRTDAFRSPDDLLSGMSNIHSRRSAAKRTFCTEQMGVPQLWYRRS